MKTMVRALLTTVAGLGFVLGTPALALAQDDVTNTKHNLSVLSGGTDPTTGTALMDYGEVCVYCHTPHGGQVDAPLWNRAFNPGTNYQMYDDVSSASIDMSVDGMPTGVSLACLSCHDGTIGLDVITNAPNAYTGSVATLSTAANQMPVGITNLGEDLRNDHPISVVYDNSVGGDPAFNSIAAIEGDGIKLFIDPSSPGQKVQCASCHNPHDNDLVPFLRIANTGSNLCKSCHIK